MAVLSKKSRENGVKLLPRQHAEPVMGSDVEGLLDSKIIIAGPKVSNITFMKILVHPIFRLLNLRRCHVQWYFCRSD